MGFKVEVLRNRQPVKGVSVKVMYNKGQDNGSTDNDGFFDTKGSGGTVKEVFVSGTRVFNSSGRDFGYNDTLSVSLD